MSSDSADFLDQIPVPVLDDGVAQQWSVMTPVVIPNSVLRVRQGFHECHRLRRETIPVNTLKSV